MVSEIDALRLAIEKERGAHQYYSDAAERATSEVSRNMFTWLAREEKGHLELLENQCAATEKGEPWLAEDQVPAGCKLSEPIDNSEFPALSEAKDAPKTESPEMEILSKAIADERDAASSYAEMAEGVSDPKGKEMLRKLSAIEKGHLALLEEEYEFIRRSKSIFPLHRFTLPPG
jgi:rubrerythrin